MEFQSNQELYAFIDELSKSLEEIGLCIYAKRFHTALHEIAWTTTSELFPALQNIAEDAIKNNKIKLSKNIEGNLNIVIDTINTAMWRANNPN